MRVRDKLFAAVAALVGMLALPVAVLTLRHLGPAARVEFFDYLPVEELAVGSLAALVGAALGATAPRWFARVESRPASRFWSRVRQLGCALLLLAVVVPQLRAFPASASVHARDAWARERVRYYPALTRVIAAIPELQRDVGRIVAMAPTADDQHVFAREMDGDDMRFTLDVIGEKGRGRFHAVCTLDDYRVYDWQPSLWQYGPQRTPIDHVPERVPR